MHKLALAAVVLAALAASACSTNPANSPDAGACTGAACPHSDAGHPSADGGAPVPGADGGGLSGQDAGGSAGPCSAVTASAADPDNYQAILGCLRNSAETDPTKQQAVQTFVAAVESHDGFPIVSGNDLIFVYVRDPAFDIADDQVDPGAAYSPDLRNEPIRVAGDFTTWQPSITMVKEGESFFHVRTAQPGSAGQRWTYKFVAKDTSSQDVWYSDPLSRRFDYDTNGRISIVSGSATQGHLEWFPSVHATQLNNDRPVYIYVPRGYDTAAKSYPVVYMHDGNNLFNPAQPRGVATSWQADAVAETEINAGNVREFIIVGPANTDDRMNEYTQTGDTADGTYYPGKGDQYADFLVNDLKPLVDQRYRTMSGFADTAILGSSLGGLISYYIAYKYPAVYKYVGGMSSTFGWGAPPNQSILQTYAAATDLQSRGQVYYLDNGGNAPTGGEANCTYTIDDDAGDSDNYCVTLKMKETLVGFGIDTFPVDPSAVPLVSSAPPAPIDILHYWAPGALHNESSWHARLPMAFRLFFQQ